MLGTGRLVKLFLVGVVYPHSSLVLFFIDMFFCVNTRLHIFFSLTVCPMICILLCIFLFVSTLNSDVRTLYPLVVFLRSLIQPIILYYMIRVGFWRNFRMGWLLYFNRDVGLIVPLPCSGNPSWHHCSCLLLAPNLILIYEFSVLMNGYVELLGY